MTQQKQKTPLEYWLALISVEGLASVQINRLITHFGSVPAIFDAELPEIAALPTLNPVLASRILTASHNFPNFRERLDELEFLGIRVMSLETPGYPSQLKDLPDAPVILCSVGTLTDIGDRCVSIVGSRRASAEGLDVALTLATQLAAAGFTVVSGLARGIDTCAHSGALAGGGETIGVLGTDLSYIYPEENRRLAMEVCEQGCLFSEHPFPAGPSPRNLVKRNRIISGLSIATIVVESGAKGGAMHTARYAQRQDRGLLACRWDRLGLHRDGARELIGTGAFPFAPTEIEKVVDILMHPERLETYASGVIAEQIGLFDTDS